MSYLFNALSMLIGLAFDAVVILFLLRVTAEACRADFNNPLSQFIYRTTNPVLAPIRRMVPNWGRINLAGLLVLSLAELLDFVLLFYIVLIFGWSLLSMFSVDRRQPMLRLVEKIVAPLLRPLDGKLVFGQIDFAPMAVIIVLFLARMLIAAPLLDLGAGLAVGG